MGAEYIINNNFNVMLKGRDPLEIQSIMADFNGYRRHQPGRPAARWCSSRAMAGPISPPCRRVEMALWDLAGKALGLPIHQSAGRQDPRSVCRSISMPPAPRSGASWWTELKLRALKVGLGLFQRRLVDQQGLEKGKRFGLHMTNNQIDDTVNFFAGFRKELGLDTETGAGTARPLRSGGRSEGLPAGRTVPRRCSWKSRPPATMSESMLRIPATAAFPSRRAKISTPVPASGPFWKNRRCPSSSPTSPRRAG